MSGAISGRKRLQTLPLQTHYRFRLTLPILSTAGILIRSESALYAKTSGERLTTQEEALHLYDRVVFVGAELPDGSRADANFLWLSDWYRENIDALFTAPLDYNLWRYLEERSSIASRLYEFLLLNFYGPVPVLRINYETLTQFLPIHAENYLSVAKGWAASAVRTLPRHAGVSRRAGQRRRRLAADRPWQAVPASK